MAHLDPAEKRRLDERPGLHVQSASLSSQAKQMQTGTRKSTIYVDSAVDVMPNELLDRILGDLTWNELVKVSWVHERIKAIVQNIVTKRVEKYIGIYVDANQVPRFLEILHGASAGVAGGVVRCIMSPGADGLIHRATPHTMDVVFPFDKAAAGINAMHRLLTAMGYVDEIMHLSAGDCDQFASKYIIMEHKTKDRAICLVETLPHKNLLDMTVENQHTLSMYLMTSTRMYCFFPALHANKRNLILTTPLEAWNRSLHVYNFGVITVNSTKHWGKPCGVHCPARWRQTRGLEGVSVFGWKAAAQSFAVDGATSQAAVSRVFDFDEHIRSNYRDLAAGSNLDDPLGTIDSMWRLSAGSVKCDNNKCRHRGQGIDE